MDEVSTKWASEQLVAIVGCTDLPASDETLLTPAVMAKEMLRLQQDLDNMNLKLLELQHGPAQQQQGPSNWKKTYAEALGPAHETHEAHATLTPPLLKRAPVSRRVKVNVTIKPPADHDIVMADKTVRKAMRQASCRPSIVNYKMKPTGEILLGLETEKDIETTNEVLKYYTILVLYYAAAEGSKVAACLGGHL